MVRVAQYVVVPEPSSLDRLTMSHSIDKAVSRYYASVAKQLDFLCKDAEIQTFKTC